MTAVIKKAPDYATQTTLKAAATADLLNLRLLYVLKKARKGGDIDDVTTETELRSLPQIAAFGDNREKRDVRCNLRVTISCNKL